MNKAPTNNISPIQLLSKDFDLMRRFCRANSIFIDGLLLYINCLMIIKLTMKGEWLNASHYVTSDNFQETLPCGHKQ